MVAHATDILLALRAVPDSVRVARYALRGRGLDADVADRVALLTSELVANAIRHAGRGRLDERIVFHARLADDRVRVEVDDGGPGFDPAVRHGDGFGLRLVDALASRWGVDRRPRSCRVWFEVDRGRPAPSPT